MNRKEFKTEKFQALVPFTVKDDATVEDKTSERVIRIAGYCNWSGNDEKGKTYVDLAGDVVVPSGVDTSVWEKNPLILWQHDREKVIGRGLRLEKRDDGLYIEAEIHADAMDPQDFYRVKSGLVKMFSIGFRTMRGEWREVDGEEVFYITKCLLLEDSVVSIPANSFSGFSVMKSLPDGTGCRAIGSSDRKASPEDHETKTEPETINKEVLPMLVKVKRSAMLPAAEVEHLKGLGINVDEEVEIDLITLIKNVSTEVTEGILTAREQAEKEAAEKAAAEKEAAEKAAAEKAAAEAAEREAAEEAEAAEALRALAASVSEIKSVIAEEK